MKVLVVLNDPAYGTEKTYNGLRAAMALQKDQRAEVFVYLMDDAVGAGVRGQKTPDGFYNLERMLKAVLAKGGHIKYCSTCSDARGLTHEMLLPGLERGSMAEFAEWVVESDRTLSF